MKRLFPLIVISSFFLSGCQLAKNTTVNNLPTPTPTPEIKTTTAATSLKDLLAGGKAEKCTWVAEDNGNKSSGTLYISGKKFKQEVNITDSETQTVSQFYSLSDGAFLYTWGSAMGTQGFKISLEEMETVAQSASVTDVPSQTQTTVDLNKQYQYQCQPWTANETDFSLPTGVAFTDMSEQMKQLEDLQKKLGR